MFFVVVNHNCFISDDSLTKKSKLQSTSSDVLSSGVSQISNQNEPGPSKTTTCAEVCQVSPTGIFEVPSSSVPEIPETIKCSKVCYGKLGFAFLHFQCFSSIVLTTCLFVFFDSSSWYS